MVRSAEIHHVNHRQSSVVFTPTRGPKKALRSTITEMTDIIHERQEALNHSQLNTIKREKPDMVMLTLNSQQKRAFKQRAKPVREKYIEMTGKQGKRLLEALEKAFDTGP